MARRRIDELPRIVDRCFAIGEHSLLENLGSVTDAEWEVLPEGAERTIRDIVQHAGMFKHMYANHGFHDASMDYGDDPAIPPDERLATKEAAIEWLWEAHAYLREAIDGLPDDAELAADRKAHWGEMVPTVLLVDIMHEHDVYHAGEINRTRRCCSETSLGSCRLSYSPGSCVSRSRRRKEPRPGVPEQGSQRTAATGRSPYRLVVV